MTCMVDVYSYKSNWDVQSQMWGVWVKDHVLTNDKTKIAHISKDKLILRPKLNKGGSSSKNEIALTCWFVIRNFEFFNNISMKASEI